MTFLDGTSSFQIQWIEWDEDGLDSNAYLTDSPSAAPFLGTYGTSPKFFNPIKAGENSD